jgi:hypothetical protein
VLTRETQTGCVGPESPRRGKSIALAVFNARAKKEVMSQSGLKFFDTTIQKTNVWRKEILEGLHEAQRLGTRLAADRYIP